MLQLNIDVLVLIFKKLQDRKSLHSCLLVNREWCCLVVPILWKEYSWREYYINGSIFFNTILSFLPSSSKQFLSDNDIKLPSTILLKPPLYSYISFCDFPDNQVVKRIIEMVLGDLDSHDKGRNLLEQEIYKLFVSQCKDIKNLYWMTSQPLPSFQGAFTCLSQLDYLSIDLNYVNSNVEYIIIDNYSQDIPGLISN